VKLKDHSSLPGYMTREKLFSLGPLNVRLHTILTEDGTPLLHNHPFGYMSLILRGGYDEQVLVGDNIVTMRHSRLSLILRGQKTYHRISKVLPGTKTLFIAFGNTKKWDLKEHDSIRRPAEYQAYDDGLYLMHVKDMLLWCKHRNGMWHIGSTDKEKAEKETRLSIHQNRKQ
jgi:hypothetical protein